MMDELFGLAQQGLVDYYVCRTEPMKWPASWFRPQINREFKYEPATGEFVYIPEHDMEMFSRFTWWKMGIKAGIECFIKALRGPMQFIFWVTCREGNQEDTDAYGTTMTFGPFGYYECNVLYDTVAWVDLFGRRFRWSNTEFEGKEFKVRKI